MKGDFSRVTNRNARDKHYSGVLSQQGRVELDADKNELQAILKYRDKIEATDVIGRCGTPKHNPGFEITTDGTTLSIAGGRYYVDGLLAENDGPADYDDQPDLENPAGVAQLLEAAGAVQVMLYLDVWERHITALDDSLIREEALGGPDTTTRVKTVWQVKALPLANTADCESLKELLRTEQDLGIAEWDDLLAPPQGMMNARTQSEEDDPNECLLPPSAGYRGLENQLYRVEIHTGGDRNTATYKWSRDNGSIAAAIQSISGAAVTVHDTGRDDVLSFAADQWVEITGDPNELAEEASPGELHQIQSVNPATREIILKTAPTAVTEQALRDGRYKLRRWDQTGDTATANGVAMTGDWSTLENGIQVEFSDDDYRTGDYWLIPARTVTGEIEWPPYEIPNENPEAQLPFGIDHHYCPLALVGLDDNNELTASDCRLFFPPLTDITASDVYFDDTTCANVLAGAETVQEAIDILCLREQTGCTLSAVPGPGWESVFDAVADGEDAQVCFQVGDYPLENTAVIADKGHIRLVGNGFGTRILAMTAESALRFESCDSVTVNDLHVETGSTGAAGAARDLNGALTFCDCDSVNVENVSVRCAAGTRQQATCLTVIDTCASDPAPGRTITPTFVRVRHCDFSVGNRQTGILLVNAGRVVVEDNYLAVTPKPRSLTLDRMVADRVFRADARTLLISDARPGEADAPGSAATATVRFGGNMVSFNTAAPLANEWQLALERQPPGDEVNTPAALLNYMYTLADRVLLNAGALANLRAFRDWYRVINENNPAVASQGIVVAGHIARDVSILNNTIDGFLQGIRVGVSHRESVPGTPDMAGTVTINNNRLRILLPPIAIRERFGIFVGNCDSLMIDNNHIRLDRRTGTGQLYLEGIRVYGHFGKRIIARHNHLDGFSGSSATGIRIRPLNTISGPQWLVADNVASVIAPSTVRQSYNMA